MCLSIGFVMCCLKGQCQGIAHMRSHARSHVRVTSKNKTVGEVDLSISQLFRFCSILSVQIKCYGVRGSNKLGKLSWITVHVICRCFLLCNILANLIPLLRFPFQVCFCKATCSTGTSEKRSGCPCKTGNRLCSSECHCRTRNDRPCQKAPALLRT